MKPVLVGAVGSELGVSDSFPATRPPCTAPSTRQGTPAQPGLLAAKAIAGGTLQMLVSCPALGPPENPSEELSQAKGDRATAAARP